MTPEHEKAVHEERHRIQRERANGNPDTAAEMADNLRLVLEIERIKAMDRAAAAAQATAMGINALVATTADLANALQAMAATIRQASLTVAERAADADQLGLFEDDACACGHDHGAVG